MQPSSVTALGPGNQLLRNPSSAVKPGHIKRQYRLAEKLLAVPERTSAGRKPIRGAFLAFFSGISALTSRLRRQQQRSKTEVSGYREKSAEMNDPQILQSLQDSHRLRVKDMGAGGNCLFLSVALQVDAADVESMLLRSDVWRQALGHDLGQRWVSMNALERASALRRISMLDEADFISDLAVRCSRGEVLPDEVEWRVRELFKDMAEEFIGSNKTELAANIPGYDRQRIWDRVREVVRTTTLKGACEFVLKHADEYMATTGREGNWAGSSEMAAMARALQRTVIAYGNDWVTQDSVTLHELGPGTWQVQPYFQSWPLEKPDLREPIQLFQTHGGGHYQMLTKS
eukprot:TRINITY_DN33850_c0_g1_i1.p1 TRINITY_DN33850_c0_g1~~TRINITY_DN33850_c0_g1_i1.p1  ORF type:complete len:362 (+),score=43.49 TRINITY_DN33850_c0_g1_i1:55-1086(+)